MASNTYTESESETESHSGLEEELNKRLLLVHTRLQPMKGKIQGSLTGGNLPFLAESVVIQRVLVTRVEVQIKDQGNNSVEADGNAQGRPHHRL